MTTLFESDNLSNNLQEVQGPYIHLLVETPSRFMVRAQQLTKQLETFAVRSARGASMETKSGVFSEFARALDFPSYFGGNWDAFDECLTDLEWLPAAGYSIWISESEKILAGDLIELPILLNLINGAATFWAQQSSSKPFHVLFECCPETRSAMEERLATSWYDLRVLTSTDLPEH